MKKRSAEGKKSCGQEITPQAQVESKRKKTKNSQIVQTHHPLFNSSPTESEIKTPPDEIPLSGFWKIKCKRNSIRPMSWECKFYAIPCCSFSKPVVSRL